MAFYEYRCEDCKTTFTVSELTSEHDEHKKEPECPKCGKFRTHQILSGFYAKTDSKT